MLACNNMFESDCLCPSVLRESLWEWACSLSNASSPCCHRLRGEVSSRLAVWTIRSNKRRLWLEKQVCWSVLLDICGCPRGWNYLQMEEVSFYTKVFSKSFGSRCSHSIITRTREAYATELLLHLVQHCTTNPQTFSTLRPTQHLLFSLAFLAVMADVYKLLPTTYRIES